MSLQADAREAGLTVRQLIFRRGAIVCFVAFVLPGCVVISMLCRVALKHGWRSIVWLWNECDDLRPNDAAPQKNQKNFPKS